jgi:hypothetical protein
VQAKQLRYTNFEFGRLRDILINWSARAAVRTIRNPLLKRDESVAKETKLGCDEGVFSSSTVALLTNSTDFSLL